MAIAARCDAQASPPVRAPPRFCTAVRGSIHQRPRRGTGGGDGPRIAHTQGSRRGGRGLPRSNPRSGTGALPLAWRAGDAAPRAGQQGVRATTRKMSPPLRHLDAGALVFSGVLRYAEWSAEPSDRATGFMGGDSALWRVDPFGVTEAVPTCDSKARTSCRTPFRPRMVSDSPLFTGLAIAVGSCHVWPAQRHSANQWLIHVPLAWMRSSRA